MIKVYTYDGIIDLKIKSVLVRYGSYNINIHNAGYYLTTDSEYLALLYTNENKTNNDLFYQALVFYDLLSSKNED